MKDGQKDTPQEIRDYFSKIGARGGRAGKGSPKRIAANKRAAIARWQKLHPAPRKLFQK